MPAFTYDVLSSLVLAQDGASATSWAPGYLVVILGLLFVMMVTLAPSRRADKPKQTEFAGTSWGKVVTSEIEKKKEAQGPAPGVFAPGQLAQQRKR
ncbi:MAG: hypothetical protein ACUVQG_13565 [Thermogutta sp.]